MQDSAPLHRIYQVTSIGRPLDPAWPSNRAVMFLMPAAALAGFAFALLGGMPVLAGLWVAAVFALAVFGTWALARELLPDDHVASFVSMGLGFMTALAYLTPGLLVLFTTLGLVRIVNRSTGLKARTSDSIVVTCLLVWTVYATESPWFGMVGAVAFFLDGVLVKPQKKQWLFSLLCFGCMVVYIVDHDVDWWLVLVPDVLLEWLAVLALLMFALSLFLLKKVHSRGDTDHVRLDVERVKAGMGIAILATLQGLEVMPQVALLVATIGGLCLGIAFRRAFRSPVKGLRAG